MKHSKPTLNRRLFHVTAAAAASAYCSGLSSAYATDHATERLRVGWIGTGNQGMGLLKRFLAADLGQVVAVCDVNEGSFGYKNDQDFFGREPAKKRVDEHYWKHHRNYEKCASYLEYERVLDRNDLDAVLIVTPDHSHRTIMVQAASAGKAVYCEKPLSHSVTDGEAMVQAADRHGILCQTGSHERSNPVSRFVIDRVREGKIGRVKRVETTVGFNNKVGPGPGWKPMPVPASFDYKRWLGPAPAVPYHPDRCLYRFRFQYDYAGGQIANFGAHCNDLALWGVGQDRQPPRSIRCLSANFLPDGSLFNTALETDFEAQLDGGVTLRCTSGKEMMQTKFIGEDGWVLTGYRGTKASDAAILEGLPEKKDARGFDPHTLHMEDFVKSIKENRTPRADIRIGANSALLGNLANIAVRRFPTDGDRVYQWDAQQRKFRNAEAANQMLTLHHAD